ncbi:hypothetical protein [Helicobacter sp. MIT 05-5294]|uniref:hypothetical protein n=1 Tax=Helicobacter sp. MIT 05-5294 TaxID=1548150 RepID=UPI000AF2E288|nr:hypothetical protein [Helicobacter sp. MIT 05-5294]
MIIPKSFVYIVNRKEVRDFLKPTFFLLADCGKAWSYVLLEMIIFARQKGITAQTYND